MPARILVVEDKELGKQTEFHMDGNFVCSFDYFELSDRAVPLLEVMLDDAFSHGKRAKENEIKSVLGCR